MRARRICGADALLELVEVEPPGGAVLAQLGDGGLALVVGGAQTGVAPRGRARRRRPAARRPWWREWHIVAMKLALTPTLSSGSGRSAFGGAH